MYCSLYLEVLQLIIPYGIAAYIIKVRKELLIPAELEFGLSLTNNLFLNCTEYKKIRLTDYCPDL